MAAVERLASSPQFSAKVLTLSTWDSQNFCAEADLPNLRQITADWRNAKELWYQRRGYVPFLRAQTIPTIPEIGKDGTTFGLHSVVSEISTPNFAPGRLTRSFRLEQYMRKQALILDD